MTADLLEALVQAGHVVDIYAATIDKDYERNGVRITSAARLHAGIAATYDVFITHPEIRIGAMKYVRKLPYIGIVHNTSSNTLRSLDRQAPLLTVANSKDTYSKIPKEAFIKGRVTVINPPVCIGPRNGSVWTPEYMTQINLSHEKGGTVLRYVAAQHPDVSFLGVEGGHGVQVLQQPPNVRVIRTREDMHSVYDRTSVLLFPTKRESYGKVAAEAMQWGIPCVVSDLPALHEVCGESAIFIDPADYAGWSRAVSSMTSGSVIDDLSNLALERGKWLRGKSQSDLERWTQLVAGVAGR